jgi:hypothetical protein
VIAGGEMGARLTQTRARIRTYFIKSCSGNNTTTTKLPRTKLGDVLPPIPPPTARGVEFLMVGGGGRGRQGGAGEGGEIRRGEVQVAAHSRTCTRWLKVSAKTMRPSLSMAMPP